MRKYSKYSSVVLRFGLGAVLLWFGINEIINPAAWTGLLPSWISNILPLQTFIVFNGSFEVILGLMLLAGIFTRVAAVVFALHLANIIYLLGYDAIAVRDFGLMLASIALALQGNYPLSVDSILKK